MNPTLTSSSSLPLIDFHLQFPWYSVENYTVATRNQLFTATRDQIKTLVTSLKRGGAPNLSQSLLTELMLAGLNASGFSEKQRWELVEAAEYVGGEVKLSPLMKWWPWETVGRKIGSEEEVIEVSALAIVFYSFSKHELSPSTCLIVNFKDTSIMAEIFVSHPFIIYASINTKFHTLHSQSSVP